ncbi:MAG: hypothetical protein SGARI_001056 [Bacillariaceae sp.]
MTDEFNLDADTYPGTWWDEEETHGEDARFDGEDRVEDNRFEDNSGVTLHDSSAVAFARQNGWCQVLRQEDLSLDLDQLAPEDQARWKNKIFMRHKRATDSQYVEREKEQQSEYEQSGARPKRNYVKVYFPDHDGSYPPPAANNTTKGLETLERSQQLKHRAFEQQGSREQQGFERTGSRQQKGMAEHLDKSEEKMMEVLRMAMTPQPSGPPAKRQKTASAPPAQAFGGTLAGNTSIASAGNPCQKQPSTVKQTSGQSPLRQASSVKPILRQHKKPPPPTTPPPPPPTSVPRVAHAQNQKTPVQSPKSSSPPPKADFAEERYVYAKKELQKLGYLKFLLDALELSLEDFDRMSVRDFECYTRKRKLDKMDFYEVKLLVQNEQLEKAWNSACAKKLRVLLKKKDQLLKTAHEQLKLSRK